MQRVATRSSWVATTPWSTTYISLRPVTWMSSASASFPDHRTASQHTKAGRRGSSVSQASRLDVSDGHRVKEEDSGTTKFPVSEARRHVIVHQAARLHERVADRRADEPERALLQVPAHRLRLRGLGGDVTQLPEPADDRSAPHE